MDILFVFNLWFLICCSLCILCVLCYFILCVKKDTIAIEVHIEGIPYRDIIIICEYYEKEAVRKLSSQFLIQEKKKK